MAEKVLQMIADLTEIFDEEYGMRHLITPANTAQKLIDKGYRKLSADVVEVVRCKDCVSSRPLRRNDRFEALFAEGCVYCMRNDDGVDNEHFCGFGERKDDNHETYDGN